MGSESESRAVTVPVTVDEEVATADAILERVHPEDEARVAAAARRAIETGEACGVEYRTASEEDPEWVESWVVPVGDDAGAAELQLVLTHDITDRRERERELQRRNEQLEEFAAVLTHDLRTPLNVAHGNLEMERAERDSERLEEVHRALERMEELVDDVLTHARDGEPVTQLEPVSLAAAARDCWGTMAPTGATLRVETDATVLAAEDRLKHLLDNLLGNAVEHGGGIDDAEARRDAVANGGTDVSVTVGGLDEGFYVADDGPGIPPGERDAVFDRGNSGSQDGRGSGLAIVAQVADAHGWEVAATESEDGGARFEVTGVAFVED